MSDIYPESVNVAQFHQLEMSKRCYAIITHSHHASGRDDTINMPVGILFFILQCSSEAGSVWHCMKRHDTGNMGHTKFTHQRALCGARIHAKIGPTICNSANFSLFTTTCVCHGGMKRNGRDRPDKMK
jgi:hypothetical protein